MLPNNNFHDKVTWFAAPNKSDKPDSPIHLEPILSTILNTSLGCALPIALSTQVFTALVVLG